MLTWRAFSNQFCVNLVPEKSFGHFFVIKVQFLRETAHQHYELVSEGSVVLLLSPILLLGLVGYMEPNQFGANPLVVDPLLDHRVSDDCLLDVVTQALVQKRPDAVVLFLKNGVLPEIYL